jgi:hypothetical protein
MSSFRLLVPLLLATVCVAPVAAQSSLAIHAAALAASFQLQPDEIRVDQNRMRADSDVKFNSADLVSGSGHCDLSRRSTEPIYRFAAKDEIPADADPTCYSMRSYRVTRDDPQSDSTRLAGYSVCQPSARFQVKSADYSPGTTGR